NRGRPGERAESTTFVAGRKRTGGKTHGFDGKERTGLHGFGEVDDGGIIGEPGGVRSVGDHAVTLGDANFLAGVVEDERLRGVLGFATVVHDRGGEELGEDQAAVGGPAKGVNHVAEGLVAAGELLAFEQAAALAASFLEPDVVVFKVVKLGFEVAMNGIDDAAIRGEGESGDFFVDVLERLVEVLGEAGSRKKEKRINTEDTESAEDTE